MLSILGTGHFHPEIVLDNTFLEELDIGTSNEWIMERVGISTRHTVLPLEYIKNTRNAQPWEAQSAAKYSLTDIGVRASEMAMKKAQIQPSEIGMVICGTCTPQYCLPANACAIASRLGITAPSLDINTACSTFAAHMHFINGMQSESLPEICLLVNPEILTTTTDYSDKRTAVLFGDGAAAVIVSKKRTGKAQVIKTYFDSDPVNYDKVLTPYAGHFTQEGSKVQRFAILQIEASLQKLLENTSVDLQNLYFIGHQANKMILDSAVKRMGIDPHKHFYNVNQYGNIGGAGAPSVLSQKWDFFKPGDHVAVVVIGAGLSWGSMLLRF